MSLECHILLVKLDFYLHVMNLTTSNSDFCFKAYFVCYCYSQMIFIWLVFSWYILFQFDFQSMSLCFKCAFYKQKIAELKKIQSDNLCFLTRDVRTLKILLLDYSYIWFFYYFISCLLFFCFYLLFRLFFFLPFSYSISFPLLLWKCYTLNIYFLNYYSCH